MMIRIESGITVITADYGKILKSVFDKTITSKEFWLGCNDAVENYVEIVENLTE